MGELLLGDFPQKGRIYNYKKHAFPSSRRALEIPRGRRFLETKASLGNEFPEGGAEPNHKTFCLWIFSGMQSIPKQAGSM